MIKATEKENVIDQAFRDAVGTIDQKGKRNYIFPKKPKGSLYNKRTIASIVYLIVFFSLPLIKVNGEPLIMLNVLKRKFIIFGQIFGPQDFFIFALGMITFIVFIILFTVVFGRVFCGWACPQTIFMEMVFRKIEYWNRRRLQQATTIEVHALERFQDQETGLENNCLLPDLLPDCQLFHGLPDQHG